MTQHHTKETKLDLPHAPLDSGPENCATIALLERWADEDSTNDPAVIAQAERELAEFKSDLNANRTPDKAIFP